MRGEEHDFSAKNRWGGHSPDLSQKDRAAGAEAC